MILGMGLVCIIALFAAYQLGASHQAKRDQQLLDEYKSFTSELEVQYDATLETLKIVYSLLPKEAQETVKIETTEEHPIVRAVLDENEEEAILDEEPLSQVAS